MRELVSLETSLGHRIQAFKGDAITRSIQQHGVYDPWTLSAIEFLLKNIQAETCLDVGANIGNHALSMASHCQTLVAFEPVPFIHEVLTKNLSANTSNTRVYSVALSDTQAKSTIRIPSTGNLGQSSMAAEFENEEDVESFEIQSVVGDEFLTKELPEIASSSIDFIKIDVEGFESQVVLGLRDTIVKNQSLVLLEWNSPETREGFSQHDLLNTVFENYRAFSLTHRHSKQLSGRGLRGSLMRLKAKMSPNAFCVDNFDPKKDYPNVLLIPNRWHALIDQLPRSTSLLP